MSVLSDYKVQFFNRKDFGKNLSTNNTWLSAYISDHYDTVRVNRLLSGIERVINGEIELAGGITQSLYLANITSSDTKIYKDIDLWEQNNNIAPDFELPTTHFKIIVEAWRNYLLE